MIDTAKYALDVAKAIQNESSSNRKPPDEGSISQSDQVIAVSIVRNTRSYIERVSNQINGAYEHGWYDACAVMIRRLIETLIIEVFESHNLADRIKNASGDFYHLKDLVNITLGEKTWNLGRNTKMALPRIKDIGDQSAHSRRFIAHRSDIDKIIPDLRIVVQELVILARLK